MKRFVFSMEKILELRRFELQEAEGELGKANAEVSRIQRELDAVASQYVSTTEQYDATRDFEIHLQAQSYFDFLDKKKEDFLNEMTEAKLIADQKRELVREAMQKVKALEKLREKKFEQWKRDTERAQEEESDDLSIAKYSSGY